MGHDLPRALWPAILEEISALAAEQLVAVPGRVEVVAQDTGEFV
jgi:hypothetical protein